MGATPLLLAILLGSPPCAGLPLEPGTSWTYRAAVAWTAGGSDSVRRDSVSWTTTVLAASGSDSTLAATVSGWPTDLAWWEPGRTATVAVVFCSEGRVYLLHSPAGPASAVVESLLNGARRPTPDDLILQLPLRTGQLFGRAAAGRSDALYAWLVESAEPVPPAIRRLRPGPSDSLYSVAYRSLPDHTIVGFVPELGVVHYMYVHHGTTAEADAWLVGFHEGKR